MVNVVFEYDHLETVIQAKLEDSFNSILKRYINKTNLDLNGKVFLSNGKTIQRNDIIGNVMSSSERINERMKILVKSVNELVNPGKTNIIKSNDIICPKCKEICIYEIKDYKIK